MISWTSYEVKKIRKSLKKFFEMKKFFKHLLDFLDFVRIFFESQIIEILLNSDKYVKF